MMEKDVVRHRQSHGNNLRIQVRQPRLHAMSHRIPVRVCEQVRETHAANVRKADSKAIAALRRRRVIRLVQAWQEPALEARGSATTKVAISGVSQRRPTAKLPRKCAKRTDYSVGM